MIIEATNFIESEINKDLAEGKCSAVQTRHPPEPSGYLHIGHVRNIVLNYGTALKYGGVCNLRYDDTNPLKEKQEFVDALQEDVLWLGYKWANIKYATDYFQQNYEIAVKLIKEGKAYVDDLSPEELSATRGTLTEPGKESPYRNRSVEENLELFEKMKNGEFEQGKCCLRAKIDMASPNMNMRDPVIYRIQYLEHQRIGRSWNIYPSYDFSHPLDDALEGVTHSICGLEFEDHRPLYNWVVENSGLKNRPRQIEYSNLLIKNAVSGKRNIKKLVEDGIVSGWDDPRLYTLRGLRRRGVLPQSLIEFVRAAGFSKSTTICERSMLEYFIRNTLNEVSKRVMAVLDPIKLVITNMEGEEYIELEDYPQNEETSKRTYKFGKELLIERSDFEVTPPPKYHRLYVGNKVRLKGAFVVTCTGYDLNEDGTVKCVYAEYDPTTKSGMNSEVKVKGT
ncbi:MAG: glutamine--tRNA ligase, partial [Clostridia bacterium]|nr:glutamine--tRNA ligase [Clostridia bacterium]